MKKTVYHTSGSSLALYLIFDVLFLAIPILSLHGLIQSFKNGDITFILGDLASFFLVYYLTAHLVTNRIVLSDDSISVKEADARVFYHCKSMEVPLSDIKAIYMGGKSYLYNELDNKKQAVEELDHYYERFEAVKTRTGKTTRIKIPPVVLIETTQEKYFAFGSRPYAQGQIKNLFSQLTSLGISISTETSSK